uniref:Angiomotin_C domain-containing protein n=1 Tax=Rhabditophanes sp. KR3021 TaxID=114890 RepID=A0AC35TIS9_9BILA
MKTSPTSRDSYASAIQNHPTVHDQNKQAPPPYQSSFGGVNRPKILQKNNNIMSASQYLQQNDKEENDYDVVADYDLKDRVMSDGSSETYSYLPSSSHKNPVHGSGNNMTSSYSNSIKSISSRSPGPNTKTLQNQVTQSPSDSGIVDYETIIKDKENELNNVRQTMEANEEVLVRVYQDKERSFRSEIVDLKQKLKASQQGESGLRSQMQISEEQREQMALTIKALQSDKNVMAQKCSQIEKELYGMKNRIQEMAAEKVLAKNKALTCDSCRLGKNFMTGSYMGNDKYHSSNGSSPNSLLHTSYMTNSVAPPVPAPRQSKEMDTNLRGEVESLRNELKSMKDMFKEQIQKWEKDDVNVNNNMSSEMTYKGNEPVGRSKTMSYYKPMVTDHHTIRKPIISSDRLI